MKKIILFALLALFTVISCDDKKEKKDQGTEGDTLSNADTTSSSGYSPKLMKIVKGDSGVFRGADFNMTAEDIKSMEDSLIGEYTDSTHSIDYLLTMNPLEEAEISYIFDDKKTLNQIEVNIYPADERSQSQLFNEFISYFNKKYGASVSITTSAPQWVFSDIIVVMNKTGNDQIHDIRIEIKKANATL